jgi:hypothetical protein
MKENLVLLRVTKIRRDHRSPNVKFEIEPLMRLPKEKKPCR